MPARRCIHAHQRCSCCSTAQSSIWSNSQLSLNCHAPVRKFRGQRIRHISGRRGRRQLGKKKKVGFQSTLADHPNKHNANAKQRFECGKWSWLKDLSEGSPPETLCTVGGIQGSALQRMSWHYNARADQCVYAWDNDFHPIHKDIRSLRAVRLLSRSFTNTSWFVIIWGSASMKHNTATNYKDINLVNRFEENPDGIINFALILIHLNGKIKLKFMITSKFWSPDPISPSPVCFNASAESEPGSVSETLSFSICIMFVFIHWNVKTHDGGGMKHGDYH